MMAVAAGAGSSGPWFGQTGPSKLDRSSVPTGSNEPIGANGESAAVVANAVGADTCGAMGTSSSSTTDTTMAIVPGSARGTRRPATAIGAAGIAFAAPSIEVKTSRVFHVNPFSTRGRSFSFSP